MARPRLNFPGSLVSDIAQLKMLDGRPATFLRFNGPDRYVVLTDGEERTITRAEWGAGTPPIVQRCKSAQGNVERLGYDPDCVAGTAPHYIVDRSRADRRDPNLAVCTVRSGAADLPIKRRPAQSKRTSFRRSRIVAVSLKAFTTRHSHKTRCVSRALLPDQPGITRRSRSLPIEAPSHHRDSLAVLSEDAGWIVRE
jgi:hypothetical protein